MGVDFVEIDVRRTSDGIYVNLHDDRTPSGRAVHELSYGSLAEEFGAQLTNIDDVMAIVDGKVGLHVDVKEDGYEADVVRRVQSRCPQSDLVFTGGDVVIRAIKELFPTVRAGLSLGDDMAGAPPWRYVRMRASELFPGARLRRCHADFASVHQRLARVRVLGYCARIDMPAWVWTVDDEVDIKDFMGDPRVAVLITDRPDVALRFRTA